MLKIYPLFEKYVAETEEVLLDENQKTIINERGQFLPNGEKENWRQISARVALIAAKDNLNYPNDFRTVEVDAIEFFDAIYNLKLVPASPILLNAASDNQQMFPCFAVVVPDNMKEQYELSYTAAKIFAAAAGLGMNYSRVRPAGYPVGKNGAIAYGVLKEMYAAHVNCSKIQIGAVGRRGAQLAALDVYHPEIFKFVSAKQNEKHYSTFNLSVIIDGNFLEAVKKDKQITCRTWKNERPPKFSAKRLFSKISEKCWYNGEPGILFIDNANANNIVAHYSAIEACNICGEVPTIDYGSCNLCSVNLLKCLNEDYSVNYKEYEIVLRICARFLDNLIGQNDFPHPKFKKVEEHLRSIGVSLMGFADLLIKLKIPYNSEEGRKLGQELAKFRFDIVNDESHKLAIARGVAPVLLVANGAPMNTPQRRNAFLTAQAPSGSVSMIANCSPSMEPLFGLVMTKRCMNGKTFKYVNVEFEAFLKQTKIPENHLKIIRDHVDTHGSIHSLPELVNDDLTVEYWSQDEIAHFVTAHDIHYTDRLKMQAAFQQHTDQAISSTVNLPETATKEDVADMIFMAYDLGLKGFCCFRNNSRAKQILNIGSTDKNTWLCTKCGGINTETDQTLDPTKVCLRCQICGSPSCANS